MLPDSLFANGFTPSAFLPRVIPSRVFSISMIPIQDSPKEVIISEPLRRVGDLETDVKFVGDQAMPPVIIEPKPTEEPRHGAGCAFTFFLTVAVLAGLLS